MENTRGGDYRRRDGSLEIQIVKSSAQYFDTIHTRYVCGHLLVLAVKHRELDATRRRTRDHMPV